MTPRGGVSSRARGRPPARPKRPAAPRRPARSTLLAAFAGATAVVVAVVLLAVHLLASPGSPGAAQREHDAGPESAAHRG